MLLAQPIENKLIEVRHGPKLAFAVVSMQGSRLTMEDRHVLAPLDTGSSVAGVFDGHGGAHVAEQLSQGLAKEIQSDATPNPMSLAHIFNNFNVKYFADDKMVGSTAVVAVVTEHGVFVCNVGDSRAYAQDPNGKFVLITDVHQPSLPEEAERIHTTGHFVARDRVDGCLAVSRAFGDFGYCPAVVSEPHIVKIPRYGRPIRLVLISDGIVERRSDKCVTTKLDELWPTMPPHLLGVEMCNWALGNGSTDNCTVMVVEIDGQRSERAVDRSFGDIKHKPWFMYADRQFEEAYKNDLLRYNLQQ